MTLETDTSMPPDADSKKAARAEATARRAKRLGPDLAEFAEFVVNRIRSLGSSYLHGQSAAAASLARLRRAVDDAPGANPVVWAETLGLPPRFAGYDDEPSAAERAVHYTVTLFALHQQAKNTLMHRDGATLGHAVRQLGKDNSSSENAVLRRFQALGTSETLTEAATHARGLVSQLRSASIPLDYGLLSIDFLRIQDPRQVGAVRLQWGRDYYRVWRDPSETAENETASETKTAVPEGENL